MNTQVRIKELSIDANGDVTVEGVEIDVSEKTLLDLFSRFLREKAATTVSEEVAVGAAGPTGATGPAKPTVAQPVQKLEKMAEEPKAAASGAQTTPCPECDTDIELEEGTLASEIMQCTDCGTELEVESLNPPVLVAAPEECEDWGE